MIARFFYGGYNATTSILLAVLFNFGIFVLSYMGGMLMLPFISFGAILLFPLVGWGLVAAARGPNTHGIGSFMCGVVAFLQFAFIGLTILGWFL